MIKYSLLKIEVFVELLKLLSNFFFYFMRRSQEILKDKINAQKVDNPPQIIKFLLRIFPIPGYQMSSTLNGYLGTTIRNILKNRKKPEMITVVKEYGSKISYPEVSIIVPLYARLDFMKYQLALFADDPDFQDNELIYVLDDPRLYKDFVDYCDAQFATFQVPFKTVYSGANLGFSGANNLGVSVSSGRLIVLINSDVMPIESGWVSSLANIYKSLNNVGAIGPKLLYGNGSIQHAGMKFIKCAPWGDLLINDHPRKNQPNFPEDDYKPQKLAAITGACLMVSKQLYEQVDGLNEEYIINDYEDSDFCLKLHTQGFDNYYIPDIELFHLERQSVSIYPQNEEIWQINRTKYNCWLFNQEWGKYINDKNL
ncbi:glycosyltransferase [Geminocystis sp. GBBB08]|uniref:glycosyltransferase family 2 protein n=1 Tax=Geminocystis sp. GBBB08 TaxID=2604140 RepID=UPI0027E32A1B|nr:glycosyltransferase [Geminocystis sp. GBBB08]MBL1210220.1 glycosyltransferase family 2 protein [Geminocystis sp. GBBB08]